MNESLRNYIIQNKISCIADITWAHAVNDVKHLLQILNNPKIDFLEVDISLSKSGEPIAAHYSDESDLTFANLLNIVKQSSKGIKLDFKDQKTILPCLQKLGANELTQPVILNADILNVKGAPQANIDPAEFIKLCQQDYPKGLLSLGWRTNDDSVYSAEDIDEMLRVCEGLDDVTFAVRASTLPRAWNDIERLIEVDNYTLTIWNGEPLSSELKDWVYKNTDKNKCFYDFSL